MEQHAGIASRGGIGGNRRSNGAPVPRLSSSRQSSSIGRMGLTSAGRSVGGGDLHTRHTGNIKPSIFGAGQRLERGAERWHGSRWRSTSTVQQYSEIREARPPCHGRLALHGDRLADDKRRSNTGPKTVNRPVNCW